MSYRELFMEDNADGMEMFDLAYGRIKEICSENELETKYAEYFNYTAKFLVFLSDILILSEYDGIREKTIDELKEINEKLYFDVKEENYHKSYLNPDYMVAQFGEVYGKYLSYLSVTLRKSIPYAFSYRVSEFTIYLNYFLEIYSIFKGESELIEKELTDAVYWFESDYSDIFFESRIREQYDLDMDFYKKIVTESDLDNPKYLYYYGLNVSSNELKVSEYLSKLSDEKIDSIAATFTNGFRKGFELAKKDMSKKDRVEIRYALGFERVVKAAMKQFKSMGLDAVIRYNTISTTPANKQMIYDHKFDQGLYLDKAIVDRKISMVRVAFEKYKESASLMAGPACIETFGEDPFSPVPKTNAIKLSDKQRKLTSSFDSSYIKIFREYQKSEDTSFTIIAYPVPEIGDSFETLFDETIKINNLDDEVYLKIQQSLIDALDESEYVIVKGKDENTTDMKVYLHELKDKTRETNFENCLADVNIPLGEVFTSPVLKGTSGILNVSEVYLNDLKYSNLKIVFEDGMVKDYSCDNLPSEKENKLFIKENLLQNRETLPIGEFAIGTNTTAYAMARKYNILYKLPILIVEKMGPHFAIGDTCYSYEEDVMTYNPDGKAIIARENELSALRNVEPEKAYFGVHTDITIPYDELLEISAIKSNGDKVKILENGRFVLNGTEELNTPF